MSIPEIVDLSLLHRLNIVALKNTCVLRDARKFLKNSNSKKSIKMAGFGPWYLHRNFVNIIANSM